MTQADDRSHLDGAQRIAEERHRQIALGYRRAHDVDEHGDGALLAAADCYLAFVYGPDSSPCFDGADYAEDHWPWDQESWKPSGNPIRNLEKAGALIAAEIDRLARTPMGHSMFCDLPPGHDGECNGVLYQHRASGEAT